MKKAERNFDSNLAVLPVTEAAAIIKASRIHNHITPRLFLRFREKSSGTRFYNLFVERCEFPEWEKAFHCVTFASAAFMAKTILQYRP